MHRTIMDITDSLRTITITIIFLLQFLQFLQKQLQRFFCNGDMFTYGVRPVFAPGQIKNCSSLHRIHLITAQNCIYFLII